jgi:hypothetical protein
VKQSKPFPKVLSSISFHMSRSHRGGSFFVKVTCLSLAGALARYAAEVRGPGLVHRVGRDVQYGFVKGRLVRAGGTCRRRAFSDRGARGRGWPHLRREAIDPAGFGHRSSYLRLGLSLESVQGIAQPNF